VFSGLSELMAGCYELMLSLSHGGQLSELMAGCYELMLSLSHGGQVCLGAKVSFNE
jgi:predicted MPP superfamily phosphohydrolase